MTCLFCAATLSEALSKEQVVRDIMPIIKDVSNTVVGSLIVIDRLQLSEDHVPNVRFNVAKSLARIAKNVPAP